MLYIVRHGQTEWNLAGRYQGHADSPLTALGVRQARAVAAYLGGVPIARLYASPLGRAWTTAACVAAAIGVDPVADERLKECDYGDGEGLTFDEIDARFAGKATWRAADKWHRCLPGGETYGEVHARAKSFAEERLAGAGDKAGEGALDGVCVVAHDGLNRALAGHLLGWSREEIMLARQTNDAVWRLDANGGFQAIEVPVA